ncbi:hypothetical protein Q31b_24270 [Novipirellula aureliae]|uniref:3-keto-alpha-glucoside-1,2-lyase/3-keto-2-hydroxy-glucal hydratase domain-containing protein n=1 Tax=Novipirellula aureliae TaxID=2527966 RepID=A0A5C6E3D5_9BACT|nr:DUF1080 domain-containing protein [Novipirellula aureliae]TWU43388.1 hypothetical protein Q31b_24270 [Novipirellula aureliae]
MKRRFLVLLLACGALSIPASTVSAESPQQKKQLNQLTDQEKAEGWRLLFDGISMDSWRSYKKESVNDGWKVVDGAMVRGEKGADDIITKEQFDAFELSLEYKISKGGNSGVMFHVTEEGPEPYSSGPEIQIQDNVDGHDPQKAGWLYQFYSSEVDATKPVGEWNELRLILHSDKSSEKSEVFMNGTKYYEFVKGSDDWNEKLANSKFASWPLFAKASKGHIALQDHGNIVSFRNLKIRPLEK